jgi:hypothetical protein
MISSRVLFSACPMWSTPVTLGGGDYDCIAGFFIIIFTGMEILLLKPGVVPSLFNILGVVVFVEHLALLMRVMAHLIA